MALICHVFPKKTSINVHTSCNMLFSTYSTSSVQFGTHTQQQFIYTLNLQCALSIEVMKCYKYYNTSFPFRLTSSQLSNIWTSFLAVVLSLKVVRVSASFQDEVRHFWRIITRLRLVQGFLKLFFLACCIYCWLSR